jgi:hypothetical protein
VRRRAGDRLVPPGAALATFGAPPAVPVNVDALLDAGATAWTVRVGTNGS